VIARILIGWAVLAVAFYVTTLIVPGIQVTGGVAGYLLVALIFGLINAILGPIVRLLTLPLSIVTFGLFFLVVNAFLLWLTEVFTDRLHIEHFFFDAIFGALILGIDVLAAERGPVPRRPEEPRVGPLAPGMVGRIVQDGRAAGAVNWAHDRA
jgi:putative membrane protein